MNVELKALLQAVFDLVKLIEDAVAKKSFPELFPGLYKLASDIPAIIANWNDLLPELQKLDGVEADMDLIAFVSSQLANVTQDQHAKNIVAASLDLLMTVGQKAYALQKAIKG